MIVSIVGVLEFPLRQRIWKEKKRADQNPGDHQSLRVQPDRRVTLNMCLGI